MRHAIIGECLVPWKVPFTGTLQQFVWSVKHCSHESCTVSRNDPLKRGCLRNGQLGPRTSIEKSWRSEWASKELCKGRTSCPQCYHTFVNMGFGLGNLCSSWCRCSVNGCEHHDKTRELSIKDASLNRPCFQLAEQSQHSLSWSPQKLKK